MCVGAFYAPSLFYNAYARVGLLGSIFSHYTSNHQRTPRHMPRGSFFEILTVFVDHMDTVRLSNPREPVVL